MPKRAPKITPAIAADILGINRTRDGDLRPMVKALGMMAVLNTAEENQRREAARWALRNWSAYQDECSRRRELKAKPVSPLDKATRALLAEVRAHLDGNDDADMERAADAADEALHRHEDVTEPATALLSEVDALLDYEDDAGMQAAAEALRELLPAPAARPAR